MCEESHVDCFYDVDEFLVLKKHNSVVELLCDHCKSGALSINWYMFGSSGHQDYSPISVTKRLQWRDPKPMHLVKEIVRLTDMNLFVTPNSPHYVLLLNGTRHDTKNTILTKWYQVDGPVDVTVLNHTISSLMVNIIGKAVCAEQLPMWT